MSNEPSNAQTQGNGGAKRVLLSLFRGVIGILAVLFVLIFGPDLLRGSDSGGSEPKATVSDPIPEMAELELVGVEPSGETAIVRTGSVLKHVTQNCDSPVSTKETSSREHTYELSVELNIEEAVSSATLEQLTGGNIDITQVEVSVAEDIGRELRNNFGIRIGELFSVGSSREIETPGGYRSEVSLQWQELLTVWHANVRVGSGELIKLPFWYVSDIHLAQVGTLYTSCYDGTTIVSSPSGRVINPGAVSAQNSIQIVGPANTECKNPVQFSWISEPNRQYRVTARPLGGDSQTEIGSAWVQGGVWEQGLPANLWGSWEWIVIRDDNVQSTPAVFVFNPFPAVDVDQGCSTARVHAVDSSPMVSELERPRVPAGQQEPDVAAPAAAPTDTVLGVATLVGAPNDNETGVATPVIVPTDDATLPELLPTPTSLPPPTEPYLPPYPVPSAEPFVPTPEVEPSSTPIASNPYPPPTPYVYP